MRTLCVRLRPLTTWVTPWRADSLFGALCWAIVDLRGEAELRRVLEAFRAGEPPFVLSDACPGDLLPRPLAATPSPPAAAREKAWRRSEWLTEAGFRSSRDGQPVPIDEARRVPVRTFAVVHAALDRRTGTTAGDGGALYELEEATFDHEAAPEVESFSVYYRAMAEWESTLVDALRAVGLGGFGKRRSTGKGAFEIAGDPVARPDLDARPGDDAFVTLSHFVPAETDPTEGQWRTHVTDPKMARGPSPWKRPVVTLAPGSCFRTDGNARTWVGTMLAGVAPARPDVLHYAFGFPVSMRWPQGGDRP